MAEHQQLKNITAPHANDVLSGRGNSANRHPGNAHFRSLVKGYREDYVACPKSSKALYSQLIYDEIRSMDPPGRFLRQDPNTKLWSDIGKKAALAKIRQALREGAPDLLLDLQTVEQIRHLSPTECAQDPSHTSVESTGPESLGLTNGNKHVAFQFSGSMCNHVKGGLAGAGTCVTESSASSQSGDSVSYDQIQPNILQAGQMQTTPQPVHPLQQLLNIQSTVQNKTQPAPQVSDALLRFQRAFIHVKPQVNREQNVPGTFSYDNFIENTPSLIGLRTTPFVSSAMSLPQQQRDGNLNNRGNDNAAALLAILGGSLGVNSNNSNVNNAGGLGDSAANNWMELLQSHLVHQQLQPRLG